MTRKWMGEVPTNCDHCDIELKRENACPFFVDGRSTRIGIGVWSIMCPYCHKTYGLGLGTGYGQKYDVYTLEKIEG